MESRTKIMNKEYDRITYVKKTQDRPWALTKTLHKLQTNKQTTSRCLTPLDDSEQYQEDEIT